VRKAAFDAYYSVYDAHINTFASLLSTEVKKNNFYAKTRNYPTARAAALFDDFIPESVYDALIEAVHDHLDVMHRYMALRKKALGVDELHMYDLYCPMVPEVDFHVEIEEAREMLLSSFAPLGTPYTGVVDRAFDEGWIDLYENKGKRSGAYSWGTYDSNPYILMNYHGTLDHVFTLGHEMGHAMHSYLTRRAQPYVYGSYSIFVAEVASTTNEALMTAHLLKTLEDEEKKRYVLNHYLEQFRTTLFRQTMFAEFEREIHGRADAGEALTAEKLKEIYRDLNETYYGPDVVVDDAIALEWARIPHFYYNFYVFQYATGFSAAVALSEKLLSGEGEAVEAYLAFLSAGSSAYPIDVLRKAGADMTEKDTVARALEAFAKGVEQMESLL
jgi:oligoendopeptidase F